MHPLVFGYGIGQTLLVNRLENIVDAVNGEIQTINNVKLKVTMSSAIVVMLLMVWSRKAAFCNILKSINPIHLSLELRLVQRV